MNPSEPIALRFNTLYCFIRARQLEGTLYEGPELGVWPITSYRVLFGWGHLVSDDWDATFSQADTWPPAEPPDLDKVAKKRRIRYYQRVRNLDEFKCALANDFLSTTSLQITEDWLESETGVIPDPREGDKIIGCHVVTLHSYDDSNRLIGFQNNWGPGWGNSGTGTLSYKYFNDRSIESWIIPVGYWMKELSQSLAKRPGMTAIDHTKTTELMYSLPDVIHGGSLHGYEIYDFAADERIAWAFATPRGGFLDIEELFVRPPYRRMGFATRLCNRLLDVSAQLQLIPRLWVSFADCGEENRAALEAVLRALGLSLRNTNERWAAFVATPGHSSRPLEPIQIPDRPAMRRGLRKAAVAVLSSTIALGSGTDMPPEESVVTPPAAALTSDQDSNLSEHWEVLRRDQLPPDALVRLEHAGEWVAWDQDLTRAVATGTDMEAVRSAAVDAGVDRPVMEWVPPTPVRPIGQL